MKIVLIIIAALFTFVGYCCCVVAGDADRQAEEMAQKDAEKRR